MGGRGRVAASVLMLALLWAMPLQPAAADHDDGWYELPSHANWDHGDLSVLIIPPLHGQIYNFETGALNGGDPAELTPFNSYLEAIEAAIGDWDKAINQLGADWLKAYYEPTVYVLGRDDVPPEVMTAPDILVITDENEGPSLGTAIWGKTGHVHTPCIVRMSSSYTTSFTYADMYNITAQEYGHCLGLGHVGSQAGVDPTSEQKHPEHDVMNGFYADSTGEAGTHLHCVSNLNVLALEHVFDYKLAYSAVLNLGVPGTTVMHTEAYGDTCEPPPADWRAKTPPTLLPGALPMNSVIESPADGAKIATSALRKVRGTGFVDQSTEPMDHEVEVALMAKAVDGSCNWWNGESKTFVTRDCYSPFWHTAESVETGPWEWRAPKALVPGQYRVIARVVTRYGNETVDDDSSVDFTVTRPRTRKR